MSVLRTVKKRAERRTLRVRSKFKDNPLPRVSVFKSLKHIYAQIIDDAQHKTVVSCSTLELEKVKGDKTEQAHFVGLALAKRAQEAGIKAVVFDRGPFLYHGRLKALAEGLREGGLKV